MLWAIYNVGFAVAYLLVLPRFIYRMWRRGGYRKGFLQRLGRYEPALLESLLARRRWWIHAVSVGEIQVAFRVMEEIRRQRPDAAFVVTTTTSTAHRLAEQRVGSPDVLLYFPSDFPFIVRRVLGILRPLAVILIECELWPNLIRMATARGVPVFLVNARVSVRSYRGYRKIRPFMRRILERMELILAQSDGDRERLAALGARPEDAVVMNSAKYDIVPEVGSSTAPISRVLDACGMGAGRMLLVGGSTWAGEEKALLDVYRNLRPRHESLRLVLVPRHAERREEVEREVRNSGFSYLLRSALGAGMATVEKEPDVLLVDSTGELKDVYAAASVIFVGKSLFARGGQNVIEPASLGKAVVVGPHMGNFDSVMPDFLTAAALVQVPDAAGLDAAVERLLSDAPLRDDYGRRARAVVEQKRGAVKWAVQKILDRVPIPATGRG